MVGAYSRVTALFLLVVPDLVRARADLPPFPFSVAKKNTRSASCLSKLPLTPNTNLFHSSQRLRPLSYAKSHVILIAFAIDTPDSLENVSVKWNEEVRSICGNSIPVLLVGCKMDLRDAAGVGSQAAFVTKAEVRPPSSPSLLSSPNKTLTSPRKKTPARRKRSRR